MTFLSPTFMFIFLPLVLGIYAIIPPKRKADFLPVAGISFFVCANIGDMFAVLYILAVIAVLLIALKLYKKRKRRIYLRVCAAISVILAAAVLVLRMYAPIWGIGTAGIIICLMGTVSLCLDIARGEALVPKSLWHAVAYVTYFPLMAVGPFVSYEDFSYRLENISFCVGNFAAGGMLFLKGFITSVAVGAVLEEACYRVILAAGDSLGFLLAVFIIMARSIAIYAFLVGYSNMARGISLALGIELDPDMENPFTGSNPGAFLRGFFKGFTAFFKRYVAFPIISVMEESLFSRILSSAVAAVFTGLLFCGNMGAFILSLPVLTLGEYFALFGRTVKKRRSFLRRAGGCILTFLTVSLVWSAVLSGGLDDVVANVQRLLLNSPASLSNAAADELTSLKSLIIPILGCAVSLSVSWVLKNDEQKGEMLGFTAFKYATVLFLLVLFLGCVMLLLPQFPQLAADIFGKNFV